MSGINPPTAFAPTHHHATPPPPPPPPHTRHHDTPPPPRPQAMRVSDICDTLLVTLLRAERCGLPSRTKSTTKLDVAAFSRFMRACAGVGLCDAVRVRGAPDAYAPNAATRALARHGGAYWTALHSLEPASCRAWGAIGLAMSKSAPSVKRVGPFVTTNGHIAPVAGAFEIANGDNIWEYMARDSREAVASAERCEPKPRVRARARA